jgi:outer membrane protein assembly factor BamD
MTKSRVAAALLVPALVLGAGCAARRKERQEAARITDPAVLYRMALEALEQDRSFKAKEYLERIQYTPESRPALEPLVRLALADTAFVLGDDVSLIDARAKYLDFVTLYSDHPRAPYAQTQAGVCSLRQAAHPNRDQTQTIVAINDFKEVARRYPASPYVRAAADRLRAAERRLAEHELAVGRFYFKRKSYLAAIERLRGVLKKYPEFAGKERVYFYLGESLARTNNDTEGRLYLEKLLADYPNGKYAEDARRTLGQMPGGAGAAAAKPDAGSS